MSKKHVFLLLFAFALELAAAEWENSHLRKPLRTNSYQNQLKEKLKRILLIIFPPEENLRPPSVSKHEILPEQSSEEYNDEYRTKFVNPSTSESQNTVTNFLRNVISSSVNPKRESLKLESKSHASAPLRNTLYSTSEEDFFNSEQESMGEVLKKMKQYFKIADGANTEQIKQPISENDNGKEVFLNKNSSLYYKEGDKTNILKVHEDWTTPIEENTYLPRKPELNSSWQPSKQEEQSSEQDEDGEDAEDDEEDPESGEDTYEPTVYNGKSVQKSSGVEHGIGAANVTQSKNPTQHLPIKIRRKKSSAEEGDRWLPQLRSKPWIVNPEEQPFDTDQRELDKTRRDLETTAKPGPPLMN